VVVANTGMLCFRADMRGSAIPLGARPAPP
jgi:hypothetical protein